MRMELFPHFIIYGKYWSLNILKFYTFFDTGVVFPFVFNILYDTISTKSKLKNYSHINII